MTAYYNEFDPYVAQWLRNLIEAGHIAPGVVDDRSITDVKAADLKGFTQCHFFAGLGGWSYALRLAGIPDTFPCWTGSPPCQPFSMAGAGIGKDDPRHLAPTFLDLISECRPPILFGEQVANAVKKDNWVDGLLIEMAEEGYTSGFTVLPACSVGAPHKRDRIIFGAYRLAYSCCCNDHKLDNDAQYGWQIKAEQTRLGLRSDCLAHSQCPERDCKWLYGLGESDLTKGEGTPTKFAGRSDFICVADTINTGLQGRCKQHADCRPEGWEEPIRHNRPCSMVNCMDHTSCIRCGARRDGDNCGHDRQQFAAAGEDGNRNGASENQSKWADADWLSCRDGKYRAVEPGTFPLADGVPKGMGRGKSSPYALASSNRKGRLKGYGNAIVPQVAAEFIKAFMECIPNEN